MAKLLDPWDHHDWSSKDYVAQWAERQDGREVDREGLFHLIAENLGADRSAVIDVLDVGAGYGALTQFLLNYFPKAKAVCQDGSAEMAELGRKRMRHLEGRFEYALGDFSEPGWSRQIGGPFDGVVSAIAIHNVRAHEIIRSIYREIFPLVKPGGCFLNFDRMTPSLEDQLAWLRQAGFGGAKCFWQDGRRALVGGARS